MTSLTKASHAYLESIRRTAETELANPELNPNRANAIRSRIADAEVLLAQLDALEAIQTPTYQNDVDSRPIRRMTAE